MLSRVFTCKITPEQSVPQSAQSNYSFHDPQILFSSRIGIQLINNRRFSCRRRIAKSVSSSQHNYLQRAIFHCTESKTMSALFNFQSLLAVVLLVICTCAHIRALSPGILDRNRNGFLGVFWKAARIGSYHYFFALVDHVPYS